MSNREENIIGSIRPEDATTTPIVWSELSLEKKRVFGTMIDMYIAWTLSVTEIMEEVEIAMQKMG